MVTYRFAPLEISNSNRHSSLNFSLSDAAAAVVAEVVAAVAVVAAAEQRSWMEPD